MSARDLRVAVLLTGGACVAEWMELAVGELAQRPGTRLEILVAPSDERSRLTEWLVALYRRLDRHLFPPRHPADTPRPVDALRALGTLHAYPARSAATAAVAARVAEGTLDLVVDLTDDATLLPARPSPRLGTWILAHDGVAAPLAARAAVLARRSTIRSTLQTVGSAPGVLYETVTGTDHVSPARAEDHLRWKSIPLAARALSALTENPPHPLPAPRRAVTDASAWRTLGRLPGHAGRYLRFRATDNRRAPVWVLLVGRGDGFSTIEDVRRLAPADGTFWADPFLYRRDGSLHVFFEEFPFATGKGHISVLTLGHDLQPSAARVVLERPYHLSYPFVFEHAGELLMVPETAGNRTIEVYGCDRFPDRWSPRATLMNDIHAVDTTLLEHDGRWWMFTNIAPYRGSSNYDELFVFSSTSPLARDWTAHPMNPVVSHAGYARPAGPIRRTPQGLLRPSQDCTSEYGRAIRINRIDELSPTTYRETPLATIEPDWDPRIVATHTLSCLDGVIALDGKQRPAASASADSPRRVRPVINPGGRRDA